MRGRSRKPADRLPLAPTLSPRAGRGGIKRLRHRADDLRAPQHADLDRRDDEVFQHGLDLRRDDRRRRKMDRPHSSRVLGGQRGDHARAVDAERSEGLEISLNPGAAARIRACNGQGDREPLFHAGRVAAIHSRARASGSAIERDVGDDGDDVRARGETQLRPFDVEAADRDQRDRADAALPLSDTLQALRRKSHGLENCRIDRAERDVVGIEPERAVQFGVVVGADAEPQARLADRADVGMVQIGLAEMDPSGALVDRDAPEIVDDKDRASFRASRQRLTRLARDPSLVPVLDPQLHEPRADAGQARDPRRAVDDGVERIEA